MLKNMVKVGDKVTFGRSGEKKISGTVVKKNPKTARIKTSSGEFVVTYNFIQKKGTKKKAPSRKRAVCAVPKTKGSRSISRARKAVSRSRKAGLSSRYAEVANLTTADVKQITAYANLRKKGISMTAAKKSVGPFSRAAKIVFAQMAGPQPRKNPPPGRRHPRTSRPPGVPRSRAVSSDVDLAGIPTARLESLEDRLWRKLEKLTTGTVQSELTQRKIAKVDHDIKKVRAVLETRGQVL